MPQEKDDLLGKIKEVDITDEIKNSFLDYAMSVIVARAIPDVKDGLKPVHRRIIYAMWDLSMTHDKPHKKSARIVGEVIGKYHPHGDTAVYDTMVRMAQDFSYRYPLINGHGNFGSLDGDAPAAMRYTEAKMSRICGELIKDIEKDTVLFMDNYDGSEREPAYLPGYFPNLLINGSSGIAVGMATNIPPHNLTELVNAIVATIKNPKISLTEIMQIIPGPDFPTGGLISAGESLIKAYTNGNGSLTIRGKIKFEDRNNHRLLVITEIPYQVNKAKLVERIAQLIKEKIIIGVSDLRDESNREGIRIVIELRKEMQEKVLLNKLYKLTPLQVNYSINMLALNENQPKVMGIQEIIKLFIDYQVEIIKRRSEYELKKASARLLILEGLKIALDNIDQVIKIIKESKTVNIASESLIKAFKLVTEQAKAILEMRLQRLTGLEIEKIVQEISELKTLIAELNIIITSESKKLEILINQLTEIVNKYGDNRRSEIIHEELLNINPEELIRKEDVLIILSQDGYVKKIPESAFKIQNRGGRGVTGLVNETDEISKIISASTLDSVLFFTNQGKVYHLKTYQIETYSRQARGLPIVNLINISRDETIKSVLKISEIEKKQYNLLFITKTGLIKKTSFSEFENIRQTGKIAIELRPGDELVKVVLTTENNDIFVANNIGKLVHFKSADLRLMSRQSMGVKGIKNNSTENVVDISVNNNAGSYVLSVSEKGFAKKTNINEYRITERGTKGVKAMNISAKTGDLLVTEIVTGNEELLIASAKGHVIKLELAQIPELSRITNGVKIIKLTNNDKIKVIELLNNKGENNNVE